MFTVDHCFHIYLFASLLFLLSFHYFGFSYSIGHGGVSVYFGPLGIVFVVFVCNNRMIFVIHYMD